MKIYLTLTLLLFLALNVNAYQKCSDDSTFTIEEQYQIAVDQFSILKCDSSSFPIKDLRKNKIAFLVNDNKKEWETNIYRYLGAPVFEYGDSSNVKEDKEFNHLVLIVNDTLDIKQKIFKTQPKTFTLLLFTDTITSDLNKLIERADNVLLNPNDNRLSRDIAIQVLFNAIQLNCKVSHYNQSHRLKYLLPECMGINGKKIHNAIDSIINKAIEVGAFPGCRVLAAYKGAVVFNQAYGYHTYHKRIKVQQHDVYDLASVTKISGPLPLIMKAYDEGKIDLDKPFSTYWSDWENGLFHRSNKSKVTFREVLAHQAKLTPYINYYPMTLDKNRNYKKKLYRLNSNDQYNLRIDDHLFLSNAFKKKVYKAIRQSDLLLEAKYKYSGLSYMIYPELLSVLNQEKYEATLYNEFYNSLGASSLMYNPLPRLEENRIVPTEYDAYYRKKQLKGLVHDEAAAIMGGVSGNAGLFSSADDLAKLMQMYLQKGTYAGVRYISETTLNEFTKVQYPDNDNRRGAGFDKPLFGNDTLSITDSYPAPAVSAESFGHSGYTGTFVWVDPAYDLVYIFLSNRVYPTRNNPLIYKMNIRPKVQQVLYDAIKEKEVYQSSGKP